MAVRVLLLILVLAGGSRVTRGQDRPGAVDTRLAEIAAARAELADTNREHAIEQILRDRASLIDEHGDDPRRAIWLTDQAWDLYALVLQIDGSGLASLYGLPTPGQRRRAERVARDVHALADEAELEIERTLREIERLPGYATDEGLRSRRRQIADQQRGRRIPFLRGVGAYLLAQLGDADPDTRRALLETAVEYLEPLAAQLPGATGARARLYAALAMTRLGSPLATGRLEAVASDPAADAADVFAARLTIALQDPHDATGALRTLAGRYVGRPNVFYRVLIADAIFRETGTLDPYLALLSFDLGVDPQTTRSVVYGKLSLAAETIEADGTGADLPPIAVVARAEHLAASPGTRAHAIGLFENTLTRADLDPQIRAEALFGLSRALLEDRREDEALTRLVELADLDPSSPLSATAIELAANVATQGGHDELRSILDLMLERYPDLPDIDAWRYEAGRVALADGRHDDARRHFEAIAPGGDVARNAQVGHIMVQRAEANAATDPRERRLRFQTLAATIERVRPALEEGFGDDLVVWEAQTLLGLDEPARAIETLAEAEPGAAVLLTRIDAYAALGRTADAQREIDRLVTATPEQAGATLRSMLETRRARTEMLLDQGRTDEAQDQARRDLLPLAAALDRWLTAQPTPPAEAVSMQLSVADAYRLAGQPAPALLFYEAVLRSEPRAMRALWGKAECLLDGDDRLVDAMTIYQELAKLVPDGRLHWGSQLRMLEILDRVGRNTNRIGPRIQWLRRQDPELGGERFRRGFDALERKHS